MLSATIRLHAADQLEPEQLTIRVDGLAVWRTNAEYTRDQDVLEARDEEQCRVFKVERFELVDISIGLRVPIKRRLARLKRDANVRTSISPWLSSDPNENENLNR